MWQIFKTKKLAKQKIALLGLGQENQAFLLWLLKHNFPGEITVCDQKDKRQLNKIKDNDKVKWHLGKNYKKDLAKFDWLFRSPGWPLTCPKIKQAKQKGVNLSSPMQALLDVSPTKNIIAVTGSKGKGTSASLIKDILKNYKKKVFLAGNIGIAPFSLIDKIKSHHWLVLELSSFQLEDLETSPKISLITNFFPDHLAPADPFNPNFHPSLKKYWQAKLRIAQKAGNKYLIANHQLKKRLEKAKINSPIIYFKKSSLSSKLIGHYNQENIAAALAVAKVLKIPENISKSTIANFKNLEHRLELVSQKNGVKYFNNSFATSPLSTVLDLQSFSQPLILMAGGADKGANFKVLAKEIKKSVKYLILLPGKSSIRLKKEMLKIKYPKNKIKAVKSMAEAVKSAKQVAEKNNIVLLSTACASFGIFKNYKERGHQFKKYVKKI